jgi:hypothetical protein
LCFITFPKASALVPGLFHYFVDVGLKAGADLIRIRLSAGQDDWKLREWRLHPYKI